MCCQLQQLFSESPLPLPQLIHEIVGFCHVKLTKAWPGSSHRYVYHCHLHHPPEIPGRPPITTMYHSHIWEQTTILLPGSWWMNKLAVILSWYHSRMSSMPSKIVMHRERAPLQTMKLLLHTG